jgi:DNA excision repair protein ERCC-3
MDLANQGHIAKVEATEVWCPMTGDFYQEYNTSKTGRKRLLCVLNPAKFMATQYLIKWREAQGDKIIVFSDNVFALRHYAVTMGKPFIYGGTAHGERSQILDMFRQGHPLFQTIFLSKVGDTSLDLPEATCMIQISSQFGSRRQEAQRLGRILRAKRRHEKGFKSRFYTLVTKDTDEVMFSSKRRLFLVDQGYEFKVIPNYETLIPQAEMLQLHYYTKDEQDKLLELIKAQDETVGEDEIVEAALDDIAGVFNAPKKPKAAEYVKPKEKKRHALFRKYKA